MFIVTVTHFRVANHKDYKMHLIANPKSPIIIIWGVRQLINERRA
jgi:hypothetical protein